MRRNQLPPIAANSPQNGRIATVRMQGRGIPSPMHTPTVAGVRLRTMANSGTCPALGNGQCEKGRGQPKKKTNP